MKQIGFAAIVPVVLAGAMSASAATYYPSLDVNYSAPGNTQSSYTSPLVSLSDQFTDPDSGTPQPSVVCYYGGIVKFQPNSDSWGASFTLNFMRADGSDGVRLTTGGGSGTWHVLAPVTNWDTGLTADGTDLPFVIKVYDNQGWNVASADIFLGAGATAASEGTPAGTINLIDFVSGKGISSAMVSFTSESWASGASSVSTQGLFSATAWTPVAVPEPGMLSLLAASGLLALRRRAAR